jgi:hypothetical protein
MTSSAYAQLALITGQDPDSTWTSMVTSVQQAIG